MSKAVLVMDMPDSCYKCPFCNDDAECDVVGRTFDVNPKKGKPDWCLLRQIPEKKERLNVPNNYNGGYSHGYVGGWNACIDAIGGGEVD